MRYLLDTNACIACLRNRPTSVATKLHGHRPDEIAVCSVVRAELLFGAARSADPTRSQAAVEEFLAVFVSLSFDDAAADVYGSLRADLATRGQLIGPNDLMIAAIAAAHRLILVTHNTTEFVRVPGLAIEDWEVAG